MKQNLTNIGNEANKLLGRLAAEKKKTVMALCLIGVMVFMWARVLSNKTPTSAEAVVTARQTSRNAQEANSESKISFIELPNVKGRNDTLTRDFFVMDAEGLAGSGEVSFVSRDGDKKYVNRIAEKLKLQVIELGENAQAFINDKLLGVGDKLRISDGVNAYECEVVGIEQNTVFVRCGEEEIALKLRQEMEVAD